MTISTSVRKKSESRKPTLKKLPSADLRFFTFDGKRTNFFFYLFSRRDAAPFAFRRYFSNRSDCHLPAMTATTMYFTRTIYIPYCLVRRIMHGHLSFCPQIISERLSFFVRTDLRLYVRVGGKFPRLFYSLIFVFFLAYRFLDPSPGACLHRRRPVEFISHARTSPSLDLRLGRGFKMYCGTPKRKKRKNNRPARTRTLDRPG